jgi:hypothetical protein
MACDLTATAPMSELLCAASGSRPHIALCLGGQARTFPNTLVHRSVVEHVIQALGARTVVFACVVTSEDEQWQPGPRKLLSRSRGAVHAALRTFPSPTPHVQMDEGLCKATHSLPAPNCNGYTRPPESAPHAGSLFSAPYARSFAKQLEYKLSCFRSVVSYEQANGMRFAAILSARLDLTWYRPLPPWCLLDLTRPVRKLDWAFLIPRKDAFAALAAPHEAYFGCRRDFNSSQTSIEKWLFAFWDETAPTVQYVDDSSALPAQITRDAADDGYLCHRFAYAGAPRQAKELCRSALSANPCNALPSAPTQPTDLHVRPTWHGRRLAAVESELVETRQRLQAAQAEQTRHVVVGAVGGAMLGLFVSVLSRKIRAAD